VAPARFWALHGAYATEIAFIKSRASNRRKVDFWVELEMLHVPDEESVWGRRHSTLVSPAWNHIPMQWTAQAGQPLEPVAESFLTVLARYIWPALEVTLDEPGDPADEQKRWARSFPELTQAEDDGEESSTGVPGVLGSYISGDRSAAVSRFRDEWERVLHDPALVQEFLTRMEHDPDPAHAGRQQTVSHPSRTYRRSTPRSAGRPPKTRVGTSAGTPATPCVSQTTVAPVDINGSVRGMKRYSACPSHMPANGSDGDRTPYSQVEDRDPGRGGSSGSGNAVARRCCRRGPVERVPAHTYRYRPRRLRDRSSETHEPER